MPGVRAVDLIVDLCGRDLAFIMLTRGQRPRRDAFYDFKGKKLKGQVLDELNYQFMRRLEKEGLVTLRQLYIDGTKIEANANRYMFAVQYPDCMYLVIFPESSQEFTAANQVPAYRDQPAFVLVAQDPIMS